MKEQFEGLLTNEKGILYKDGIYFHTASAFAKRHLFYLLWGADYTCTPPYQVKRGSFDAFLLFYIKKGHLNFHYMGSTFTASENECVLIDGQHPQFYKALDRVEFYWFHFNGTILPPYFERIIEHGIPKIHNTVIQSHFSQLQNLMRQPLLNEDLFSAVVHRILAEFVTKPPILSPEIQRSRDYIDENFQRKLLIDEVANISSFSKYHFSRQFHKEIGMSPHEYLNSVRINYAKSLLNDSSMSIETISDECCFCSSANFIRTFRKTTGFTPLQFRNSIRGL